MSFISLQYILFFCIVVPLYFAIPLRLRWLLLLVASYLFYAFSQATYVLLLAFTTLIDYYAVRTIAATPQDNSAKRRLLLTLSVGTNLGVLFFFKYFNFFSDMTQIVLARFGFDYPPLIHHLILPVGISFYTFQSVAYAVDVYRGKLPAAQHLGIFAAYVAFFPQLVAGPIERPAHLLPQFHQTFAFDYERVVAGLRLVLWGAFKKIVIADQLAVYVNGVYNNVGAYRGLPLIVATLFFAFQIYYDFSGYTDIALGSARVMGFNLMENFRQPYFSRSVREFWRRWHISLGTWFREYLYIPLGGNRVSFKRNLLNLMIVFVVSGLWHGASWTFIIWGALHGTYIVSETLYSHWDKRPQLKDTRRLSWLQRSLTFGLVVFAWIFFRANSVGDAAYILSNFFNFADGRADLLRPLFNTTVLDVRLEFLLLFALIGLQLAIEWGNINFQLAQRLLQRRTLRWLVYYAAGYAIVATYFFQPVADAFIYFQF
jgi:alginate O-acetyltransferase complex protein AlgI